MMFIDGENLALRYQAELPSRTAQQHVLHIPDVAVWTPHANLKSDSTCEVVRRHYYTTSHGDELKIEGICDPLRAAGIEQPRVFKKAKGSKSKGVDISLATDMLSHAHLENYDIAILVGGDGDYVPLVNAVTATGSRVVLWALESGLNKKLEHAVDYAFDIGSLLFASSTDLNERRLFPSAR